MNSILGRFSTIEYKWKVFFVIAVGLFTSVYDYHSVVVALPSISNDFQIDLPTGQWVIIAYGLMISALLLPVGRLADLIGRKKIYVLGFTIFSLGGILAAMSGSIGYLISAKLIQGVGAAMTQGISMGMVVAAFGPAERGKALGLAMSIVGAGGVVGPAISGFLAGYIGWESVFWSTVILGGISVIIGQSLLKSDNSVADSESFDWLGSFFSSIALVSFLTGMTLGSRLGWDVPAVWVCFVVFMASLIIFIRWELKIKAPLMDVRLFKQKTFGFGVLASFLSFISTQSIRFLIPFYIQIVLGLPAQMVGWSVVPASFAMLIMGPLSGRLSDRFGWRIFTGGGLGLSGIGLLVLCTLTTESSIWLVITATTIQSFGVGVFNAPNNSSILSAVEPNRYGVISGFLNLIRNSGNVVGIALATTLVTSTMGFLGYPPSLSAIESSEAVGILKAFTSGLRLTYFLGAIIVIIGAILSFLCKPKVKI